jgi:hypothetical protein
MGNGICGVLPIFYDPFPLYRALIAASYYSVQPATFLNDIAVCLANYDSITVPKQGAIAMFRPFRNNIRPIGNNPPTLQEQHRRIFGNDSSTHWEQSSASDSCDIGVLDDTLKPLTF